MVDPAELGAEIGRETLHDREEGSAPRRAAQVFAVAVLRENPRAKLPAVLAKERTRRWMQEVGVTRSMLANAMASGRKVGSAGEPPSRREKHMRRARKATVEPRSGDQPPEEGNSVSSPTVLQQQGLFDEGKSR
jgi:hypothetical protein